MKQVPDPDTECRGVCQSVSQSNTRNGFFAPAQQRFELDFLGALGGTRTPNLLIRSQMLYPIELQAPAEPGPKGP